MFLSYLKQLALITGLMILWNIFFTVTALASDNPALDEGMVMLKAESNKLGTPKAENGVLFFGVNKIKLNFTIFDSLKSKNGGTATLFVKSGKGFGRISNKHKINSRRWER